MYYDYELFYYKPQFNGSMLPVQGYALSLKSPNSMEITPRP